MSLDGNAGWPRHRGSGGAAHSGQGAGRIPRSLGRMRGLPSRFPREYSTRGAGNRARDRCALSPLPELTQRGGGASVRQAGLCPGNTAALDQLAGASSAASPSGGADRSSDWHIQDDMASQSLGRPLQIGGPQERTVAQMSALYNNALERTRRVGVPAARAVIGVSPRRSTQCYTRVEGRT